MTTSPLAEQKAKETVAEFLELLQQKNMNYTIRWKWMGRARGGVISIYKSHDKVDREEYSRSDMNWGQGDTRVEGIHTGSCKHHAIKALVSRLKATEGK